MNTDITSVSGVNSPFEGDLFAVATRSTGAVDQILLDEVRGSVVPALQEGGRVPGYALFLGRVREVNERGVKPLLMLAESVEESQDALIQRVMDEIIRLKVSIMYAVQPSADQPVGFWGDLLRAMRARPTCRLRPAPSVRDLDYGLNLVVDAVKNQGVIRLQGETLHRSHVRRVAGVEEPGPELVAFHALRFLLAGFRRDQVVPTLRVNGENQNLNRRDPGGWT